jgi:hydroxymethylpyrimidine/phosphomethylpyrimidine kinase
MTSPMARFQYPRVLSIAGSDSGGGAGIQADLKTIAALGCYGMTAITALTAQNTQGVRAIHPVPLKMLADQIDAVVEDIGVDAVMIATSGAVLIDSEAISVLVRYLFPRAAVVTPNLDEASLLVGRPLDSETAIEAAALQLLDMGAQAVLLKGGHLPGDTVSDLLVMRGGRPHWMRAARIDTPNTHGTGCTLSSAIASHLALGASLAEAVELAREYVRGALQAGAQVRTGAGSGPLDHGYAPQAMRLLPLR